MELATSEGRENGTKTAACQIRHRFAAICVFAVERRVKNTAAYLDRILQ
jgi:hypothetical protein